MIPNLTTERIDSIPYSAERLLVDLRAAAECIDAPFHEAIVSRTLTVFDAEMRHSVVQLKATNRIGTGVFYRFFYKWDRDLTALAQESGLLPKGHTPILDLQADVLANCPGSTRAGLDMETSFGLAKVWTFTGGPMPLNEFLKLETLPASVRAHRDLFERHGLRHVFFVASDHQHDSMNVYFGLEEDCRNERWLRSLVDVTGGAPDDPNQYRQMLDSLAFSAGVGTTFSWSKPEMGRWCLYGLNLPCQDAIDSDHLPPLPERLARFRDHAPSLNARPQFNAAWSFGRAGFYVKLEKSYAKDADYFLSVEMGGNLAHPQSEKT